MKVEIVFRVSCLRAQSLHFRDGGSPEDIVEETFMITVRCGSYTHVCALRSQLNDLYPFIAVENIADLDLEVAEEYDTVATVWKNYQNYSEHGTGEVGGGDGDGDGDEDDSCDGEWAQDEIGGITNQKVSMLALSKFEGTTHESMCQFHDVILNHPVSAELKKALKDTSTDALDINSYFIRFPSGEAHKFDGHSYDSLEDSDTLVDQLLTSTEKYVITDANGGESVELSTQQCIIVDAYEKGSRYKPYIMVNKSGLRQLERFGPIGTLKIRIGQAEDSPQQQSSSLQRQQPQQENTYQSVFEAYSDVIGLFQEMRSGAADVEESAEERILMNEIARELVPLLDSIRMSMPEEEEPQPALVRRIYTSGVALAGRIVRNWIFNGLLLNTAYALFQYILTCLFWSLILPTFGLSRTYNIVTLFVVNLFSERILTMVERIGRDGGVGVFLRLHAAMRFVKRLCLNAFETALRRVALFCISYKRPVYNTDGSLDPVSEAEEAARRELPLPSKVCLFLLWVFQDSLLLWLTLVPNFADVYQRVLREQQELNARRVENHDR